MPFSSRKQTVLEAYKAVRADKGAPGYDETDFDVSEQHLWAHLHKIWHRMSSGSYFPAPVLAVEIPKKNGKTHTLGIPATADRVARMAVLRTTEPAIEPLFHEDPYG